ncbi:MAG: Colicin V production protein [Pelotomaculum sp. PtaB.Bin013]|nr:MAG: Colicin V production protein [Pelotomaculum sp. PtaB.Bin013]
MNWLDWLIIAVLAWSTFQGLRRGLLVSVAKMAGLLTGLVVAYSYYRPSTDYLSVRWHLEELMLPLTGPLLKFWQPAADVISPLALSGKQMSGDYVAGLIAYSILEALTFLALLTVTVWLVNAGGRILTSFADFSLLGPLNHLGGLLFGFLKGLLLVMIILALLSPFQQQSPFSGDRVVTPGMAAPQGKAFGESALLTYFKPLINTFNKTFPGGTPGKNILPESFNSI